MKKTLIILVLIFTLFGCEQGPLIEDYKIEGIGLGDSLVDFMSLEKIKKGIIVSKDLYYFRVNDFAQINLDEGLKTYERLTFFIKPNDSKYIIYSIFGNLYFTNIDLCYERQDKISEEFSNRYKDAEKSNGTKKTSEGMIVNSRGEGELRYVYFDFISGDRIAIQCYKYEGGSNDLYISLTKKEIITWLSIWK